MSTYLETVRVQSETEIFNKAAERGERNKQEVAEWTERLTPLEERLAKLLSAMPTEIKNQGLSLPVIRTMLAGKWRGNCHPGELGAALSKLGYQRRRNWSVDGSAFRAFWYKI
jgi:hypothetical protein